jgi:hypothetical protein
MIDGTRECRSEFGKRINLFPLQHINEFLVPYDQIGPVSKHFCESFNGSPEGLPADADAVKPNTIAVARLYNSSAMKPNAPVKSAWFLRYRKHA